MNSPIICAQHAATASPPPFVHQLRHCATSATSRHSDCAALNYSSLNPSLDVTVQCLNKASATKRKSPPYPTQTHLHHRRGSGISGPPQTSHIVTAITPAQEQCHVTTGVLPLHSPGPVPGEKKKSVTMQQPNIHQVLRTNHPSRAPHTAAHHQQRFAPA